MNRVARVAVATETDEIVGQGGYKASGNWVDIEEAVRSAVAGTHGHEPKDPALDTWPERSGVGKIVVTGETTLAAARRLVDEQADDEPACLNFASAKHPGGGYRKGAEAQEESLARASALVACLETVPSYYELHRSQNDPHYSDHVICSPGVPVFRDDDGTLLTAPYRVTFLTAAAPNVGALVLRGWKGDIRPEFEQRARRVLAAAAGHGHRRLVLGAWGCGVFRNDPDVVAGVFAGLLGGDFASAFDLVTFAVTDVVPSAPTRKAFERHLG